MVFSFRHSVVIPAVAVWMVSAPLIARCQPAASYNRVGLQLREYLVVTQIVPGSPAQKAGFQLDDWIFQPSGAPFGRADQFVTLVKSKDANASIQIKVVRAKGETVLTATLDQYDATATTPKEQRGRLGLGVQDAICVQSIQKGSAAERAGFKVGDQIRLVNGVSTPTVYEANAAFAALTDEVEAKIGIRRPDGNYTATLNSGKALAPSEELLDVVNMYADVRQNGQAAVDDYMGRNLIVEGRVEDTEAVGENVEIAFQTPFNSPDLDGKKIISVSHVTVPKRLAADVKKGELYRFRGQLADPQIGKVSSLLLNFVSIERLPVAPNDPSLLPEKKGSARYDRTALRLFVPLDRLYAGVVGNYAATATDFSGETDYFYGKVAAVLPDKPQKGQSLIVFDAGSETVSPDGRTPALVLVYANSILAQWCKQGEPHYFQGRVRRITPAEGMGQSHKPAAVFFEGLTPFPSPGSAFSPARPLLRSPVKAPAGTVKLADMVTESKANLTAVRDKYLNKSGIFEGYVVDAVQSGGKYIIRFDSLEPKTSATVTLAVGVDAAYEKSLRGLKRGYLLRFDGSLTGASTETKKRPKAGASGETEDYNAMQLTFQATKLSLREKPL